MDNKVSFKFLVSSSSSKSTLPLAIIYLIYLYIYIYIYIYNKIEYRQELRHVLCYSEFRACALIRQTVMKNIPATAV